MHSESNASVVAEAPETSWPAPAAVASLLNKGLPLEGSKALPSSTVLPPRMDQAGCVSFPWQLQEVHSQPHGLMDRVQTPEQRIPKEAPKHPLREDDTGQQLPGQEQQVLPTDVGNSWEWAPSVLSGQQQLEENFRGFALHQEGGVFVKPREKLQGSSLQVAVLEDMMAFLLQEHDNVVHFFEDCITGHRKILQKFDVYQRGHAAGRNPGSDDVRFAPELLEVVDAPEALKPREALKPPEAPEAPEVLEMPESTEFLEDFTVVPPQVSTRKYHVEETLFGSPTAFMNDISSSREESPEDRSTTKEMYLEDLRQREAAKALCNISNGYLSHASRNDAWLHRIVHSAIFECVVALAIITNAVLIGIETNYMALHKSEEIPLHFKIVGFSFGGVFFAELSLRMMSEGFYFFNSRDRLWNWFDMLCVACSVLEVVMEVVSASAGFENANIVRLARMLRTMRLSRTVRITRFLSALQILVSSIVSTMKALIWAYLLMFMLMYSCGIMFTQAATAHSVATHGQNDDDNDLLKFWGTVPKSMITLYQSVTGGISWRDASAPLSKMSWIWECLYVAYVSFTYFAVLNVVTGVFCNSAIDNAKHEPEMVISSLLSDQHWYETHLKKLFMMLDRNKSGSISIGELEKKIDDHSVRAWFAAMGLEITDAWTLFKLIDEDRSHDVSLEEFVSQCMQLRGNARSIDLALLRQEHSSMLKKMSQTTDRIERFIHNTFPESLRSSGQVAQSTSLQVSLGV